MPHSKVSLPAQCTALLFLQNFPITSLSPSHPLICPIPTQLLLIQLLLLAWAQTSLRSFPSVPLRPLRVLLGLDAVLQAMWAGGFLGTWTRSYLSLPFT